VVCALLLFATAINYIDRQVIGLLKPVLQGEFGFDERDYASIVFLFQAAYSLGLLLAGRLMDRIGVRLGLEVAEGVGGFEFLEGFFLLGLGGDRRAGGRKREGRAWNFS